MNSTIKLRHGLVRPDGRQCLRSSSRPSLPSAARAEAGAPYARLSSGASTRALAASGGKRNTRLVVCAAEPEQKTGIGAALSIEEGIFAPLVRLAKKTLGEKELKQMRAKVIKEHGNVMNTFVDTHESDFGEYVLRVLFELADTNKNGTIEEDELAAALNKLGFSHLEDKQIKKIFDKADANGDGSLCYEEWKTSVPPNLKKNLMKLAKDNGHDLGFLV